MNKQRKTVPERWNLNGMRKTPTQEKGGTKRRLVIDKGVENLYPHRNLHMGVYSSFVHSCQNLEATKCPTVGE